MRRKFEGASADASVSETAVLAAAQKQQQKR